MYQFIADQIDQLDLALDQLAVADRNFDRFALMLIDNVVELTLHQHAHVKDFENRSWLRSKDRACDPKLLTSALGQNFDSKVKLAKVTGLMSGPVAGSIMELHQYRNTAYHAGCKLSREIAQLRRRFITRHRASPPALSIGAHAIFLIRPCSSGPLSELLNST